MMNTLGVENEAKQTIEALQAELQKTKERLQAVEELKSQSGDAGKLVDSHITGKIAQLKEQIATLEKREERHKTVFADRISVFKRVCRVVSFSVLRYATHHSTQMSFFSEHYIGFLKQ